MMASAAILLVAVESGTDFRLCPGSGSAYVLSAAIVLILTSSGI